MNDRRSILKSPSADTRSADHAVTMKELEKSTAMHISDVAKAMRWFADRIEEAGETHDWTKMEFMDEFYDQFSKAQKTGEWGNGWYDEIHIVKERHHLNDRVPVDVDLVDVFEHIADCVMAGLARSGEFRKEDIPVSVLKKAYDNTVEKLLSVVDVK
mgnify:CR=1 FL=1